MNEYTPERLAEHRMKIVGGDSGTPRFHPFTASELLDREFPPHPWLVSGLVPENGLAVLSGIPGHGKSWTVLHLALCALSGNQLFGRFLVKPLASVLLVDEENNERVLQERLLLLGANKDQARHLHCLSFAGFCAVAEKDVDELVAICKANDVGLVIFDSLVRIAGGDENDAGHMSKVFKGLRRICVETGCTVLFTHHHRKPRKESGGHVSHEMRGSSDILAAVDAHLAVSKDGDTLRFSVGKLRQDKESPDFSVNMVADGEGVRLAFVGQEQSQDASFEVQVAAIEAIEANGTLNQGQLAAAIREKMPDVTKRAVQEALHRLVSVGDITVERGDRHSLLYGLKGGEDED